MTVHNSSLTLSVDGSPMQCYLARPDVDSGPHPAIIVLQEVFGVNTEVKRITDLVASRGYVGLAINYYHRQNPDLNEPYTDEGLQRGFAAASKISRQTMRADVWAAIEWLNQQEFVKPGKVATWGFCYGGSVAFVTATVPGLSGAICFYGGSIAGPFANGEPEGLSDAKDIKIPLLLAFGEEDTYITPHHVERIRKTLEENGIDAQIQVYPHVGHAFFRQSSGAAHSSKEAEVIADASSLVEAFLQRIFA